MFSSPHLSGEASPPSSSPEGEIKVVVGAPTPKELRAQKRALMGFKAFFIIVELVAVQLILWQHFLRIKLTLVPLALFGLAWLHALLPIFSLATLTVPDNTHALFSTSVLYVFALLLDVVGTVFAFVYRSAFGTGAGWYWIVVIQTAFVVLDFVQFVLLSVETAAAQKRYDSGETPRPVPLGVVLPSAINGPFLRDVEAENIKNKQSTWGGWRTRVFLWLLFSVLSIARLLFPSAEGWYLMATIPYLWPTPFLIAVAARDFVPTKTARTVTVVALVASMAGTAASYVSRGFLDQIFYDGFRNILDIIILAVAAAQLFFDFYLCFVVGKIKVFKEEVGEGKKRK